MTKTEAGSAVFKPTGEGVSYRATLTFPADQSQNWRFALSQNLSASPKTLYSVDRQGRIHRSIPAFVFKDRWNTDPIRELNSWIKGIAEHISSLNGGRVVFEQPNGRQISNPDEFVADWH